MQIESHSSDVPASPDRKVPLEPVELANLTLDVGVKLVTGTAIDGTFGMSPMAAIEMAAAMVGVAFSDHTGVIVNAAAADPGAAAELINSVMAEAMASFGGLQKATAEQQAVAMAKALGLNAV